MAIPLAGAAMGLDFGKEALGFGKDLFKGALGGLFGGGGGPDPKVQAYQNMLKKAQGFADTGEEQFLKETGQAPQELLDYQKDVKSGQLEEMQDFGRQQAADLQKANVRGPQAALIQGRNVGKLQSDLTSKGLETAYQNAAQRQQTRGGYFSGKAGRGQTALLTPMG